MTTLRTAAAALMAAILVAGCGSASSSSGGAASARPAPSASLLASGAPIASSATITPAPTLSLSVQTIPQAWTTPILDATTDGNEIIWSKGGETAGGAPDLYSYVPGASSPVLIYRGPDRASQLMPIRVSHGKYAFEESFLNADGTGAWRLWLIPSADANAKLIDSSAADPHGMPTPVVWIALTGDRLVWNSLHQTPTGPHFYLRDYELNGGITRTLLDVAASQSEIWYPYADDQGRLVYSTVEYSANGSTSYHVYFAQLGGGAFQPRQLDIDGNSTEPVLSGDTVVWKNVTGTSVSNDGSLVRYSLATGTSSQMLMPGLTGLNDETAGNRFVAGWADHTLFELYDLRTDSTVVVEKHDPTAPEGVVHPFAAGDLVVFVRILDPSNTNLQLCWLRLPTAS